MLAAARNVRFFGAVFLPRALITGMPLLTADRRLAAVAAGAAVDVALVADE